eukprot:GSMAST32.ASY1.ANO1.296.1 assembled CDS
MNALIFYIAAVCVGICRASSLVNRTSVFSGHFHSITPVTRFEDYHNDLVISEHTNQQNRRRTSIKIEEYASDVEFNGGLRYYSPSMRLKSEALKNTVNSFRTTYVFDFLETGVKGTGQCFSVNETVDPCSLRNDQPCSFVCKKGNVLTTENIAVVKRLASWTGSYIKDAFTINSVKNGITVDETALLSFPTAVIKRDNQGKIHYDDTDLVIYVTMQSHPTASVSGFAYCVQYDQYGRCTVGFHNIVPEGIDVANTLVPDVQQEERKLSLHETFHLLGCCDPTRTPSLFIQDDTTCTDSKQQWGSEQLPVGVWSGTTNDGKFPKLALKVITPLVLSTVREQYGCPTMDGMPMEDLVLGRGSHWESRLMGPELMSYGSGTGEPYLSDITLAWFEDTRQYIVRKDKNGNFAVEKNADSSLFSSDTKTGVETARIRTPGYLRWGRHQGCTFVNSNNPVEDWSSEYVCKDLSDPNATGCTSDNRMSARCNVFRWPNGDFQAPENFSSPGGSSPTAPLKIYRNPDHPALPSWYRYYGSGDSVGGFSDSMDYVPVRVGYWNCQDEKPSSTSNKLMSAPNVKMDFSKLFSTLSTDIEKFGGQSHCKNCRCFQSSLVELGSPKFSPTIASYGLCYAMNCFTPTYLQVMIRNRFGKAWYQCPSGGGKIFIPGFTGSFMCPIPKQFCDMEDTSGTLYGESSILLEWILFSVIVIIPFLFFIVLCCCRRVRRPLSIRMKLCCGLDVKHGEISDSSTYQQWREKMEVWKIRHKDGCSCLSWTLFILNIVWLLFGLVLIILIILISRDEVETWSGSFRQIPVLSFFAFYNLVYSILGILVIADSKPNLKTLLYFYINIVSLLGIVSILIIFLAFKDFFSRAIVEYWEAYKYLYAKEEYHVLEYGAALDKFIEESSHWFYTLISVASLTLLTIVLAVTVSARILTFKNLVLNLMMVSNIITFCFGLIVTSWSSYLISTETIPTWIMIMLLGPASVLMITSLIGWYAHYMTARYPPIPRKDKDGNDSSVIETRGTTGRKILLWFKWVEIIFGILLFGVALSVLLKIDIVKTAVADMSDEDLSNLAKVLEFSGTRDDYSDYIVGSLVTYVYLSLVAGVMVFFAGIGSWKALALYRLKPIIYTSYLPLPLLDFLFLIFGQLQS